MLLILAWLSGSLITEVLMAPYEAVKSLAEIDVTQVSDSRIALFLRPEHRHPLYVSRGPICALLWTWCVKFIPLYSTSRS
jgi:hypothetical protein